MPDHDIKNLYRRFMEEVPNRGNFAVADEMLADDVIEYETLPPGLPPDKNGIMQLFRMVRAAFPDLHITIDDLIAEGDRVAARVTLRGTHRGEFLGFAPTGNKIAYGAIDISRFVDGKLVEHWGVPDYLDLMQQLGAGPAAPR
jgi:predicted ester cyclase